MTKSGDVSSNQNSPLKKMLKEKSAPELIDLILDICAKFPKISLSLKNRIEIEKGDISGLMKAIRADISYFNRIRYNYHHDEFIEFEELLDKMDKMLSYGKADELLAPISDLLAICQDLIFNDPDLLFIEEEVTSVYSMAVDILGSSTLGATEKLLWAIEHIKADSLELSEPLSDYLNDEHPQDSWSEVADSLLIDLKNFTEDNYYKSRRAELSDLTILALRKSLRNSDIISLYLREPKIKKDYPELVKFLQEKNLIDDTLRYIAKSAEDTNNWPDNASNFRKIRREIYLSQSNWALLLPSCVCQFVDAPSAASYFEVKAIADKLDCWESLRLLLLDYLHLGSLPWLEPSWEWAKPDNVDLPLEKSSPKTFPMVLPLVDIVILENNPPKIINRSDVLGESSLLLSEYNHDDIPKIIASVFIKRDPARAVALFKELAEKEILKCKYDAYHTAFELLNFASHIIPQLGREEEWLEYLKNSHSKNKNKRKLAHLLDKLIKQLPTLKK
jgi:uncharacterized Zn finger protein